jgi:hypothetical protein
MEVLKIAGYVIAALIVVGLLINWKDIVRYFHISTM